VKPIINCDIKVFSPERDIVALQIRTIRSWDFPANSFDKLAFDHIMILADKLKPLRQAVKEVGYKKHESSLFFCLVTKETKKQGCMPIWTVLSLGFSSQS
jgi:hypothetical protein